MIKKGFKQDRFNYLLSRSHYLYFTYSCYIQYIVCP